MPALAHAIPAMSTTPLRDRLAPSTRVSRFAPLLVRAITVASHSNHGATHTVRLFDSGLVTCSCLGWASHKHCRHTSEAFPAKRPTPAVRMCAHCGVDVARQAGVFCSDACQDAAMAPTLVTVVEPERAPEWSSTCHCVACKLVYRFTDESPLYCPTCEAKRVAA